MNEISNESNPQVVSNAEVGKVDPNSKNIKLQDYKFPQMLSTDDPITNEFVETDKKYRAWLSTAQFPSGVGSFLAEEIHQVSNDHSKMTEAERTLWARSEKIKLEKIWGPEYESKVTLARQLISELEKKHPGIVELLDESGAGNSAMVISKVAFHAERLRMKADGKISEL